MHRVSARIFAHRHDARKGPRKTGEWGWVDMEQTTTPWDYESQTPAETQVGPSRCQRVPRAYSGVPPRLPDPV
ncbi:hypothetical protein BRAS3843_680010 [Bradyrhizobium sp. STM 3843]|nr:hypothetical protein BRAS3843_680010 [Bradyrhizobium sp. STM 3843]